MFFIKGNQLVEHFLPLAHHAKIEIIGNGLGVIGAGAARHNDGEGFIAVLGKQRDTCKLQHIQHVRVAKLVLNGKAENIEFLQGVSAFMCPKRNIFLSHARFHIHPRRIRTLSPRILAGIQYVVKDTDAKIRHTDLVGIGEAEGEANVNGVLVLDDLSPFTARITGGFFNFFQDSFRDFQEKTSFSF